MENFLVAKSFFFFSTENSVLSHSPFLNSRHSTSLNASTELLGGRGRPLFFILQSENRGRVRECEILFHGHEIELSFPGC